MGPFLARRLRALVSNAQTTSNSLRMANAPFLCMVSDSLSVGSSASAQSSSFLRFLLFCTVLVGFQEASQQCWTWLGNTGENAWSGEL